MKKFRLVERVVVEISSKRCRFSNSRRLSKTGHVIVVHSPWWVLAGRVVDEKTTLGDDAVARRASRLSLLDTVSYDKGGYKRQDKHILAPDILYLLSLFLFSAGCLHSSTVGSEGCMRKTSVVVKPIDCTNQTRNRKKENVVGSKKFWLGNDLV